MTTNDPNPRAWHIIERSFAIVTVVVIAIFGGRGVWRSVVLDSGIMQEQQRRDQIVRIPYREQPLDIKPTRVYRELLTDEELGPIVAASDPCWTNPDVGQFLHSIRLWTTEAEFEQAWQIPGRPQLLLYTPREQLKILLEHPEFDRTFANKSGIRTLLSPGEVGVTVVTNQDSDIASQHGQYHVDKLLQVLAEIGKPGTTPIVPYSAGGTETKWKVADILIESLWKFSRYQELEFTTSAYSRWLSPPARWENRFGEQCSLDDIVEELLDSSAKPHTCISLHIPYALISVYRANQVGRVLSKATEVRVEAKLREISQVLANVQRADGSWSTDWNGQFERHPNDGMWYLDQPKYPEIYATGHHLEWIALAPPELGPPHEVVRRAVVYLKGAITSMPLPFFQHSDLYPFGSHAVRALCLIRGVSPAEIRRRFPVVPNGIAPRLGQTSFVRTISDFQL